VARLVDRYEQARVTVPATLVAAAGGPALLLCVRCGAPGWTLFACYATSGHGIPVAAATTALLLSPVAARRPAVPPAVRSAG
jgi:hypothetical protein